MFKLTLMLIGAILGGSTVGHGLAFRNWLSLALGLALVALTLALFFVRKREDG